MKKVLIVLTNHDRLGDTGKPTGFYFPEVSHPVAVFDQVGFAVDYVSPKGSKAPMTGIESDTTMVLIATQTLVTTG